VSLIMFAYVKVVGLMPGAARRSGWAWSPAASEANLAGVSASAKEHRGRPARWHGRAPAGVAVLGHVGQRFGDHEVRGRLHRRVQPPLQRAGIELNRHGRARRQGSERLAQAAVHEDRRGDAARQGP
jgi:hypothetical protein